MQRRSQTSENPWNHGCLSASTNARSADGRRFGVATVLANVEGPPGLSNSHPGPFLLDAPGWSTLVAGALLLLISFITNYGDDNVLRFSCLQTADQIGVGLHLAALAALAGDVELASRLRHRASNEAARERDRADAAREQASRRAQLQNGCLVAQCQFLLADTARNRLQLSEALAVLMEELRPQQG